MDVKQLLETGVVLGGMSSVLFYLNNKVETDTDVALLGYISCTFLLVLLHQVAPLFHTSPVQKAEGIYRSSTSSGLWCSFIVPSVCVLTHYANNTGDNLDSDLLFILLTLSLTLVHYNPTNVSQMAGALVLLWLKESLKKQDMYSLGLITLCGIIYYTLLSKLPQQFPKSFTYGESTLVLQCTFLIVSKILLFIKQVEPDDGVSFTYYEFNMIKMAMLALLAILLALVLLYGLKRWNYTWKFYLVSGVALVAVYMGGLPKNNLQYIIFIYLNYLKEDLSRVYLQLWYSILTVTTVLHTVLFNASASTSIRKIFHVIIITVYIPGILFNITFLFISSLIASSLIIAIETIRYMEVPPFGKAIYERYKLFTDKQDEGLLAMTPIYLILGMSLPVWLSFIFNMSVSHISVYAGVLSVGIGDGMASLVGSKIGKIHWPGCQKTVEGSLASLISQIITLYCIKSFYGVEGAFTVSTLVAVLATTVLEAVTTQIDNLVLPLFLYLLLIINI